MIDFHGSAEAIEVLKAVRQRLLEDCVDHGPKSEKRAKKLLAQVETAIARRQEHD